MAITNVNSQDFGIVEQAGYITESLSISGNSETVELKDGDGVPVGLAVIPGLTTVTATVHAGVGGVAPTVGSEMTLGNIPVILTEVTDNSSQGDYRRFTLSGTAKPDAPV